MANCPVSGNCQIEGVVYRATVEHTKGQENVCISSTEGTFKKGFYNHRSSFKISRYRSNMKRAGYEWSVKEKNIKSCNIKWDILRKDGQFNIGNKMCKLCQEEKLAIMLYPEQHKLLN